MLEMVSKVSVQKFFAGMSAFIYKNVDNSTGLAEEWRLQISKKDWEKKNSINK